MQMLSAKEIELCSEQQQLICTALPWDSLTALVAAQ